jgi:uncharacterized membrane protein
MRIQISLLSMLLALTFLLPVNAFSTIDLKVTKSDITVVKTSSQTTVTVTVWNAGTAAAGSFTLRVGVSKANSGGFHDAVVAGLSSGSFATRSWTWDGTDWACGYGNADVGLVIPESDETNNSASLNNNYLSITPGSLRDVAIGVYNPGSSSGSKTLILTPQTPPGWTVTIDQTVFTLPPEGHAQTIVHFLAPAGFSTSVVIPISGEFQDGTPGTEDFDFYMTSTVPTEKTSWGRIKAMFGN